MAGEVHIVRTVDRALTSVFRSHKEMGQAGVQKVAGNQFGETSLRADIEAERIILDMMRSHKVPITVMSEEHGRVAMGNRFTGVLDGLDGTNQYVDLMNGKKTARYGTMFSILEGSNPRYLDFLVGGIVEHPTAMLLLASREGSFARDLTTGTKTPLRTSGARRLDASIKIYLNYWPGCGPSERAFVGQTYLNMFPDGSSYTCLRSTASHFVDFALGKVDVVLEYTRKGNLELGVAFGIVRAAGGVMVTSDGESIGPRKFLHFGQDSHVAVVSAATTELADAVLERLKSAQRPVPGN